MYVQLLNKNQNFEVYELTKLPEAVIKYTM